MIIQFLFKKSSWTKEVKFSNQKFSNQKLAYNKSKKSEILNQKKKNQSDSIIKSFQKIIMNKKKSSKAIMQQKWKLNLKNNLPLIHIYSKIEKNHESERKKRS